MKNIPEQLFYVKPEDIHKENLFLTENEYHHMKNVLRIDEGSSICAVDGLGNEYLGTLRHYSADKTADVSIESVSKSSTEPRIKTTLIQAILKSDRLDYFVEKGVEIGFCRMIPFHSQRCVAKPSANKEKRWRKIAMTAMKQSRRALLPVVDDTVNYKEVFGMQDESVLKFILSGNAEDSLPGKLKEIDLEQYKSISYIIGPEGDLTDDEINLAIDNGFHPVHLGKRRLRSETAGLFALSITLSFDF